MFGTDTLILIVDDSQTTRNLLVKQLSDMGYGRFWHASNGEEAWKSLTTANDPPIGLVFCDWNMPNMNGLDLLKKIRSDEKLKDLPFIMVTSERTAERVQEAIRAGVNNYIVKPFDVKRLKDKLKRTFEATAKGDGRGAAA